MTALVVARSEAAGSLPALRFVEDAAITHEQLTRLPENLAAPLLDRLGEPLEGQPVISDPEFGWLQLRSRLLRDLAASGEGQILPIQLAVALNSLRLSRHLTPAEYERQGGLRGLERLHVERHAKKAADAARVSPGGRSRSASDHGQPGGSKTRPVSRADFEGVLGRHGATPEASARAILQLEADRLFAASMPMGPTPKRCSSITTISLAQCEKPTGRPTSGPSSCASGRSSTRKPWAGASAGGRCSPRPSRSACYGNGAGAGSPFTKGFDFSGSAPRSGCPSCWRRLVGAGGWAADRYRRDQIPAQVMQAIGHPDPGEEFCNRGGSTKTQPIGRRGAQRGHPCSAPGD